MREPGNGLRFSPKVIYVGLGAKMSQQHFDDLAIMKCAYLTGCT